MPGDVGEIAVEHVEGARRFEARAGGEMLGYMSYEDAGKGVLDLTHTVVAPAARGQGVGEALVRGALAHARETGARAAPSSGSTWRSTPRTGSWWPRDAEAGAGRAAGRASARVLRARNTACVTRSS